MSSSVAFVTPLATFSYVHVWKARGFKNADGTTGDPKYDTTFIIPKSENVDEIMAAYNEVLNADFPDGLPYGAKPGGLLDGAIRYPADPFYADKWILKAAQNEDRFNHQNVVGPDRQPIMNKSEIYSGAIGRGHISFYGYFGGSKGIGCSLHGLWKTGDGEPLGGDAPDSVAAFGGAPATATQAAPANTQGASVQSTPAGAPPTPGAPGVPVTPPAHVMTPKAQGVAYEAYIKEGWTDAQLVEHGFMNP